MKKTIRSALAGLLVVPVLAVGIGLAVPTDSAQAQVDNGVRGGLQAANTGEQPGDINSVIRTIVNVLLFIIGVISVIMLIIGGIRYAVSGGDQGAVTSAKNTILYAIVGLVVAFFAFAIVNWVIDSISAAN